MRDRGFRIEKRRRSKFAPAHSISLEAPEGGQLQHLSDPGPSPERADAVGLALTVSR